jgi:hypothetical protein
MKNMLNIDPTEEDPIKIKPDEAGEYRDAYLKRK